MKFSFLWITDPWETLDHARDTTLRLAQESLQLGIASFWCDLRTIRWENGEARLDARRFEEIGPDRKAESIRLGPAKPAKPADFASLQYRTDPPVDLAYLHPLQLLLLGLKGPAQKRVVNPASVLFLSNEKLEASWLKGLLPETEVSARWDDLKSFGKKRGKVVLKPLHQAQSQGVELLDFTNSSGEDRARSLVQAASAEFTRPVLLQQYLPGILEGEQRLWFLDGKLLACARKLPLEGDFRVNIDRGSRLAETKLNTSEKRAAARVATHLRAMKVRLAAVDLIEAKVTDFNFTSPGLIVGMEEVLGENLARPIVKKLAR